MHAFEVGTLSPLYMPFKFEEQSGFWHGNAKKIDGLHMLA